MPAPPLVDHPLLLLDYDGTLAQIVDDPARAFPHPEAPELLRGLALRHPLRILTGRRVTDLASLLPVPELVAVGVHGMEEGPLGGEVRSRLDPASRELLGEVRGQLPSARGLRVEDKGSAIALHYRLADEDEVRSVLRGFAEQLPAGLEAIWGKKVLEVRPRGFDKGRAARELSEEHPDANLVMIGDDTTDEDAFAILGDAVTVKVGEGESAARYRLPDVDAVISYLRGYLP